MQAAIHGGEDQLVAEFVERMSRAGEGPAAREAYRRGFDRLRSKLEMYPVSGRSPSATFESAARTARYSERWSTVVRTLSTSSRAHWSICCWSSISSLKASEKLSSASSSGLFVLIPSPSSRARDGASP